LLIAFGFSQVRAADFDGQLKEIHDAAAAARKGQDFAAIEMKRLERWDLLSEAAADGDRKKSHWLDAVDAMKAVDGDWDKREPGLVNELKYREACDRLRKAWKEACEGAQGPVAGELAVRLFEVAQQALGCYRDALTEGSRNQVATEAELVEALKTAIERDPCCVVAVPMLEFLQRPDPKEAFLRADVRDSFKRRQRNLAGLSHPLLLKGGNVAEGADVAVMPWHAACELDKAISLQCVLKDLDYTKVLTPDLPVTSGANGSKAEGSGYVIPGTVLSGVDELSDPVQLLYGRFLLSHAEDHEGRLRPAFLYRDKDSKGQDVWKKRFLNLVWMRPSSSDEVSSEMKDRQELLDSLPDKAKWRVGDAEFVLYDYPVLQTEALIRMSAQIFAVRDAYGLAEAKFAPNRNDQKFLEKMETTQPSLVQTTPGVIQRINAIKEKNDVTAHPLVKLLEQPQLNPLVLVSDDDGSPTDPKWFRSADGKPYLRLDTGEPLFFSDEEGAGAGFYLDYEGARACFPLNFTAVPQCIIQGTPAGKLLMSLLQGAGYDEQSAFREVQLFLQDPRYKPPKFFEQAKAKARSKWESQTKSSNDKRRKSPNKAEAERLIFQEIQEMVSEKGWPASAPHPRASLYKGYALYGFRYLKDPRGNIVSHKGMSQSGEVEDLAKYPYEFRSPDGKHRIDTSQIYSWQDYEQLKRSIYSEHLLKVVAFHPCFASIECVKEDASHEIVNPSARQPSYMTSELDRLAQQVGRSSFAPTEPAPRVSSPFTSEMVGGDEDLRRSLSSLHQAYFAEVFKALGVDRQLVGFKQELAFWQSVKMYLPGDEWGRNLRKRVNERIKECQKNLAEQQGRREQDQRTLLAVQLESARELAKFGFYHRAIVYYNDLLSQVDPTAVRSPDFGIFGQVADSNAASTFIDQMEGMVAGQRLLLTIQAELAGVLNAAGLTDSAYFVWQRIADEFRFYIEPTIALAREYMESYGLRTSDRLKDVIADAESLVLQVERAIRQYGLAVEWREAAVKASPKEKQHEKLVATVRELLAKEKRTTEEEREIDRCLESLQQGQISFPIWLSLKQSVGKRIPLMFRGQYAIHPSQFFPASYDKAAGFTKDPVKSILGLGVAEAVKWCGRPVAEADEQECAAQASLMLAWYWLDRGERAKARAAYMHLAQLLLRLSQKEQDPIEKLVIQRSGLAALVAASSVLESPPGVSAVKTDFSAGLKAQLLNWERNWFARGQYGPHATGQRELLLSQAERIQNAIEMESALWRRDRYFFPDYQFEFGAIPDYLVERLFQRRELYQKLAKDGKDLAEKGQEAVQKDKWILGSDVDAKSFLDEVSLDVVLREEFVFLRK
jgi:hypothetical protein